MAEADGCSDYLGKEHGAGLREKKRRIVGIERGIKNFFDCGEIDDLVFDAQVVSVDEERKRGERE